MTVAAIDSAVVFGAGRMGGALLEGWLSHGLQGDRISVVDPALSADRAEELRTDGVRIVTTPTDLKGAAPAIVLLAVKPQIMAQVLPGAARVAGPDSLVISIAAGTTLATLRDAFGREQAMVRAMPNTPAQIGAGITVCCGSRSVSSNQRAMVDALFGAVGEVAWIYDESDIDAVTAVSGSGPAYVFLLAECMARAAREAGLSPDLADRLARQTVIGGGALLAESPLDAATLRENVTSPGGTTEAALAVLRDSEGMEPLLVRAVLAAKARSIMLG